MALFHKLILRFNTSPIRIPSDLFAEIHKLILNFICISKEARIAKTSLGGGSQKFHTS